MKPTNEPSLQVAGFTLPRHSAVIHFYYSALERRRFLSFLREGASADEAAILGCTRDCYSELAPELNRVGLLRHSSGITRVEISPDLPSTIASLADAAVVSLRQHRSGRLLVDFDRMIGEESIFELEASLNSALSGLNLTCVTQYDGNYFRAPITIEQFRTHALCIVGNAFYHENRDYTPPAAYYSKRAAGGRG